MLNHFLVKLLNHFYSFLYHNKVYKLGRTIAYRFPIQVSRSAMNEDVYIIICYLVLIIELSLLLMWDILTRFIKWLFWINQLELISTFCLDRLYIFGLSFLFFDDFWLALEFRNLMKSELYPIDDCPMVWFNKL